MESRLGVACIGGGGTSRERCGCSRTWRLLRLRSAQVERDCAQPAGGHPEKTAFSTPPVLLWVGSGKTLRLAGDHEGGAWVTAGQSSHPRGREQEVGRERRKQGWQGSPSARVGLLPLRKGLHSTGVRRELKRKWAKPPGGPGWCRRHVKAICIQG